MRPLQSVAMGLVVIGLRAEFGGYDALADPVGWVLVLLGVHALPGALPHRAALTTLALLAGAVSVPLWLPGAADRLFDADPSLVWTANLPQLGFGGLLCLALANRARVGQDPRAAAWARTTVVGFVTAAVLPVLVFGAGVDSLEGAAVLAATVSLLTLVVLLFSWSSRPWITAAEPGVDWTT